MAIPATFHINSVLLLIFFLMGTCVDLYVPSLPAIVHHFKTTPGPVQLTVSLYMLGYALGQLFLGILSDSLGRKPILLISAAAFSIVSFLTPLSWNVYVLNACRLLQGICIGGLASTARAVASDCYSEIDLTKIMNLMVISWALGPIVGPCIGGYLQHFFDWQADFYFFSIYGFVLFLYLFITTPETNRQPRRLQVREISGNVARIVTSARVLYGTVIVAVAYGSTVIFNIVGPFLIQVVLKYSVISYGHIALGLGLGYFSGNSLNRLLIQRWDPMKVTLVGLMGGVLTALVMLLLSRFLEMSLYLLALPAVSLFFFCGHVFPNVMGRILTLFPEARGTLSAVIGTLMAGCIFLFTSIATLFKTDSQTPLSLLYIGTLTGSLWLFLLFSRKMASKVK